MATAEAMIKAVSRGDLDWRLLVNPPEKAIKSY